MGANLTHMERISSKVLVSQRVNREIAQHLEVIEAELVDEGKVYREAYDTYTKSLLQLEDDGWKKLFGNNAVEDGFSLENRKELAKNAREACVKSPLLKRGRNVRANNVFGKGAPIQGALQPRFQKMVDDLVNQEALFSVEAQIENDGHLFTDGTHFSCWSKKDSQWETVPFDQITDIFYNPIRPSQILYYLREYSVEAVGSKTGSIKKFEYKKWIAVDSYKRPTSETKVKDIPVDVDMVIVDLPVNRESAQRLGLPDCLPALYWDRLYQESMLDKAKLNRALSTIAWLVKQKSAKGAANAGAKIATKGRNGGAGQTAVTTEGTELSALPRSGSIDFTELRPIASMVATALEVSTVAILSDSGAASGSNAAETTLDTPTAKSALVRQELWRGFYKRCFRVMGIPEKSLPDVNFPSLDTTPLWRQIQSSALAFTTGGIHQEEHRKIVLEALDFVATMEGLPQPNSFTGAKKVKVEDVDTTDDNGDPLPRQGNAGDVGALNDDDNSARDNGEFE